MIFNDDILYEIALYADIKTLKNICYTHKILCNDFSFGLKNLNMKNYH